MILIPEAFARAQIQRVSRLRGFPSREEEVSLRQDLIRALRRARSEEHAREVIDQWLENEREAPTVADLYRLTTAGNEAEAPRYGPTDGDQPFKGIPDLISPELLNLLRRKVEHGKTHTERQAAKRFFDTYGEKAGTK